MKGGEDTIQVEETIRDKAAILKPVAKTEREKEFRLKLSFGDAAPYVRWISLYFLPHSQFSPRKLGTRRFTGTEDDVSVLEDEITISIDPPGVLRVLVYYEKFGLWEYSQEIGWQGGELSAV